MLKKAALSVQYWWNLAKSYMAAYYANIDESEKAKIESEGKAKVYIPVSVFYNPVQEFNRDLTISVIREHAKQHFVKQKDKENKLKEKEAQESKGDAVDQADSNSEDKENGQIDLQLNKKYENGIRVFEGLAATGLRSVRFALEIPGLKEIIANDLDATAVDYIKKNIKHNSVEDIVIPSCDDASLVMYKNRKYTDRFDVVDLDPYGSPAHFLDGAVQSVKDGGLLCVTCTDMAVLCGNAIEKCHASYGAVSLKTRFCHEFALRILLQCIESHANHYARYIEPLLCVHVDFYIRVFVRIHTSQNIVKQSVTKTSMVYHCTGCGSFHLQNLANRTQTKGENYKYTPAVAPPVGQTCDECDFKFHLGGPIWTDRLYDPSFVSKVLESTQKYKDEKNETMLLNTSDRILGMLSVISEELVDQPFYYITDDICKTVHCTPPSFVQIRSAILHAGYQVSLSHAAQNSLKTNAPSHVVWDIVRCWVKEHPVCMDKLKEGSPGAAILRKEPKLKASFVPRDDANPSSRQKGLCRWQKKPERDWGPKPRARQGPAESLQERRNKGLVKSQERKAKRKIQQEESEVTESKKQDTKEDSDIPKT